MKKWEPDKWKHFYVGIPLGFVLQAVVVFFFSFPAGIASLVAFGGLVAVCYGFELLSLVSGKGHYDLMDAIAGIAGGSIGIALIWMVSLING